MHRGFQGLLQQHKISIQTSGRLCRGLQPSRVWSLRSPTIPPSVTSAAKMSRSSFSTRRMQGIFPKEFLLKIPKTDLHCHLDGSIRLSTLIDLAQAQGVKLPTYDETELKALVFKPTYANLEEYLKCFHYTTAVLRNAEALERVAYELALDQYALGVRYFEVRFAPQLNAVPDQLSLTEVLESVHRGLQRATMESNERLFQQKNRSLQPVSHHPPFGSVEQDKDYVDEPEFDYGIIVCAMRFFTPDFSPYYKQFCHVHEHEDPHRIYGLASMALVTQAIKLRNERNLPIVALDIAGPEAGFPASTHAEAFAYAHKKFLHKTVHAGEGYGPESIFQAITDLHAERIGHGFHLFHVHHVKSKSLSTLDERRAYVDNLTQYIGNMRICMEVCLTSNLQTIPDMKNDVMNHPIQDMIRNNIAVTLCTDNCTVSHTDMVQEIDLACRSCRLSPQQLKDIIITGFKRSFQFRSYQEKRKYNQRIIRFYEHWEREFNIQSVDGNN